MDKKLKIFRLETTDCVWEDFKARAQAAGFHFAPISMQMNDCKSATGDVECPLFVVAISQDSAFLGKLPVCDVEL